MTLMIFVVPAIATSPGLKEVCQHNTRGSWSWGLRSTLTGDMFLYAGPVTYNANVKNAWCNSNAPTPTPTASPVIVLTNTRSQLFPKTICHHNPSHGVTLTFENWQSYSGHLGQPHNGQTYDTDGPCPTASPTASPSATPTCTPTSSPDPTATPSPTATPTETATASASPVVTPTPTDPPRTDLSDGRSDGHTESLACLKASDNCNPAIGGGNVSLPETGGGLGWIYYLAILPVSAIVTLAGMKLSRFGEK